MTATLLLCSMALAAPAPPARREPPRTHNSQGARLHGEWAMSWGSQDYVATFRPGGEYECGVAAGSKDYVGTWRVEDGVLFVRERGGPSRAWEDWSVRLADGPLLARIPGVHWTIGVTLKRR